SQGRMRPMSKRANAGLLATLGAGCLLLAFLMGNIADGLLITYAADRYPYPPETRPLYTTNVPAVLSDGRVAISTRTYRRSATGNTEEVSSAFLTRNQQPIPNASRFELAFVSNFPNHVNDLSNYSYRSENSVLSQPMASDRVSSSP